MTKPRTAVVITGTRGELTANQRADIDATITALADVVIVGDCPTGADALAVEIATAAGKPLRVMRVEGPRTRVALLERNQRIADKAAEARDHGWDVICLALPGPDSRGTWDCARRLKVHGFEVGVSR